MGNLATLGYWKTVAVLVYWKTVDIQEIQFGVCCQYVETMITDRRGWGVLRGER